MSKVNSYSFGSYRVDGCTTQHHLEVLHAVLLKVCCVDVPSYDVHSSLHEYFTDNPEARVIIHDLRDLLNVSLH